jgi:hypothetical protein
MAETDLNTSFLNSGGVIRWPLELPAVSLVDIRKRLQREDKNNGTNVEIMSTTALIKQVA